MKSSLATSRLFRQSAVPVESLRDLTSVFGMGTGVALSPWSPVCNMSALKLISGAADQDILKLVDYKDSGMNLKTRKGSIGHDSSGGKLKKLLEGSTIVDLLTLLTLGLNFQILRQSASGYNSSVFQVPGSIEMVAAQLSFLVIAIYVIEAIIDSAGE